MLVGEPKKRVTEKCVSSGIFDNSLPSPPPLICFQKNDPLIPSFQTIQSIYLLVVYNNYTIYSSFKIRLRV